VNEHLRPPGEDHLGKHQRPGDAAETQIASAMEIQPTSGRERIRVLTVIADAGDRGLTDEEIQTLLEMNPSTERPRRVELVERGWVQKTGARRRTRSGRSAVVWRLSPAALRHLYRVGGLER
jgi:transcription initiation factor IIE alpha subunit